MALIESLTGSPFIKNPIVAKVLPNNVPTTSTPTFHRVKLQVIAMLETDSAFTAIGMSKPAQSNVSLDIDISSALRAIADGYTYTPNATTYPRIKFQLKVWEEWMISGQYHTSTATYYPSATTYNYAIMGGYNDYERMHFPATAELLAYDFCRKPTTSPQILCVGDTFAYTNTFTKPNTANFNGYALTDIPYGPTSIVQEIIAEGSQQIGDVLIYALPADTSGNHYQFRFINGFGVLDSVSVTALREGDMNVTSAFHVISKSETFRSFSRGVNRKQNDYETWKLTSGPLNKEWHSWFLHEFLMAENVWVKVKEFWIPCHIITSETETLYSDLSTDTQEVRFSVRLDINGPILNPTLPPHVKPTT